MITGDDTDLLAPGVPGQHVARFLDELHHYWPEMRVVVGRGNAWWLSGEEGDGGGDSDGDLPWGEHPQDLAGVQGGVIVTRDIAMNHFLDESGYELDSSGEGPFHILYRPCPSRFLRVRVEEDPDGNDRYGNFEPYEVRLQSSGLSFLTVITPDATSPFSRKILDLLASVIEGHVVPREA